MVDNAAEDRRQELKEILDTPQTRDSLRQTLRSRKTVQLIVEIAKGVPKTDKALKEEEK